MAAGFQCEIRKHAGVPNPAAGSLTKERLIANIKTITGGTDKGTDAAAQTGVGNLRPEISVMENIFQFFGNCFWSSTQVKRVL
ncbi:MAG: hypothetical protein MZV70_27475 [Desulfobacterales bacterium]|nr:hypothetical protein [Desulfobacterales bacterium]